MRVLSTGTGPVRRAPFPHGPIAEVLDDEHAGAGQPAAGYVTVPPGGGMADHAYGEPTALVVPLTGELLISGSGAAHQGKVTVGVVVLLDQGGAAPARLVRVAEAPGRGRRGEIVDVITQQQLAAPARLPGGYLASASGWARAEHWYLLTEGPLIDLDQLRPDQAEDAVLNRLTHLRAGEHVTCPSSCVRQRPRPWTPRRARSYRRSARLRYRDSRSVCCRRARPWPGPARPCGPCSPGTAAPWRRSRHCGCRP